MSLALLPCPLMEKKMFSSKKLSLGRRLTGIILLGLIAGCGSGPPPPTAPLLPAEPTVLPATPTADASVQSGTPLPTGAVITVANAPALIQLARWGQGTVNNVDYSPKAGLVAVASPFGVTLYNAQTLAAVRSLPANGSM